MNYSAAKLNLLLLVAVIGGRGLLAQETGTVAGDQPGQQIIFSAPKADASTVETPSLIPKSSETLILPPSLLAPVTAFPNRQPPMQMPPPPVNSDEQERLRQLQKDRQNWMLLTPEEIFGVTPTAKLLQPPERDAFGREKKTSQLERFLERENQARLAAGPTNGWRTDRANSSWSVSRGDENGRRFGDFGDPAQKLNRFLESQQEKRAQASSGADASGTLYDPFLQKKLTKEKLEQEASMQRFRQLMNPSSDAATPSPTSRYFPVPKPVVDQNLTQPDAEPNPVGISYKPFLNSQSRPIGLTPLPGIVTPREQPVVVPSWKPKPPPWLSGTPQPISSQFQR